MELITYGVIGFVAFVVILIAVKTIFFTTEQNTKRIVTRFGRVTKVWSAGLGKKWSVLESVSKPVSLRNCRLVGLSRCSDCLWNERVLGLRPTLSHSF